MPSDAVANNMSDFFSAHQAYLNNQYGDYVKQRNAYQQYLDQQARSEAIANIEAQKHQADHGWISGLLSGAATGAQIGSVGSGWGALAGGIIGGAAGLYSGLSNKDAVEKQAAAEEAKIRNEPLGMVQQNTQLSGNGLMDPQTWAAVTQLGSTIGSVGRGMKQNNMSAPGKGSASPNLSGLGPPTAQMSVGGQSFTPGQNSGSMSFDAGPSSSSSAATGFGAVSTPSQQSGIAGMSDNDLIAHIIARQAAMKNAFETQQ